MFPFFKSCGFGSGAGVSESGNGEFNQLRHRWLCRTTREEDRIVKLIVRLQLLMVFGLATVASGQTLQVVRVQTDDPAG